MATASCQTPSERQAPGGNATIMLGNDASTWSSSSIAVRAEAAATEAAIQLPCEPRMSPGGVDSVQLGGPITDTATAEQLLAKPSPGGIDSIEFGKIDVVPVDLTARLPVGGVDSIDFAKVDETTSAIDLLSRPAPGGKTTVILGGDDTQWSTDSQNLGIGSAAACTTMEPRTRPAPGGADSIDFTVEVSNPSVEALMARASPGGADSVNFSCQPESQISVPELLTRPRVGGNVSVVLGSEEGQWIPDSQAVGIGSMEAVIAMDAVTRQAPGGIDSIDFGSKPDPLSKEDLLSRPAVGGKAVVVLGGDDSTWTTDSSAIGVGSDVALEVEPRVRMPPGGIDSVSWASEAVELPQRPATAVGGKATVVLGGDASDWQTSSNANKIPTGYVAESYPRQVPGGVDSVDFGAKAELLTAEALLSRPAVGGADSVQFGKVDGSALCSDDLLKRPSPGGNDTVVLGSTTADWVTSGQTYSQSVFTDVVPEEMGASRPPPGGVDSIVMGQGHEVVSVDTLLSRPAVGGSTSLVLGADTCEWSACSGALGAGCNEAVSESVVKSASNAIGGVDSINFANDSAHTIAKPMRTMNATAAASRINLEDNSFTPTPGVSSNRFASGSNANSGNVLTDRPTTRVHQAPGGTSSISLGDERDTPAVGESGKRQQSLVIHQPPGGATSIHFGDEKFQGKDIQDENINSANLQQALENTVKVTQAPGGNSALVLG